MTCFSDTYTCLAFNQHDVTKQATAIIADKTDQLIHRNQRVMYVTLDIPHSRQREENRMVRKINRLLLTHDVLRDV